MFNTLTIINSENCLSLIAMFTIRLSRETKVDDYYRVTKVVRNVLGLLGLKGD